MRGNIASLTTGDMPGLELAEQRAWQSFLDSSLRLYATVNRGLCDTHHLTLMDVRLLDLLDQSQGGTARMGDLAEALLSLPSRVTRQIRRLEEQGLVRRTASPEDGRGVLAGITKDGRVAVREAMRTYAESVRMHFLEHLSPAQLAAMGETCQRIGSALKSPGAPDALDHD